MNKQLTQHQAFRYARQILLPGFDLDGQEALLGAKVLQIGAGGLGCASAQYLVSSGVGKITLVDDDVVDQSNLPRQILYTEQDVGQHKVVVAKRYLNNLNSDCEIDAITTRLSGKDLTQQIQQHDLVLDCSDNLATRQLLNQHCFAEKTPLIAGAAIRFEGQLSVFSMHKNSACYQCMSQHFSEQTLTCVEAGVISPIVGIIGNMQALEAIKLITGLGKVLDSKLLLFDGQSMQFQTFNINKQQDCPVCAKP